MGWERALRRSLPAGVTAAVALTDGCSRRPEPTRRENSPGSPSSVSGRVVGCCGQPVPSLPAVISGKNPSTAGAHGTFSGAGVTAPHDLLALDNSVKSAMVFKALTRSDPGAVHPARGTLEGGISYQFRIHPVTQLTVAESRNPGYTAHPSRTERQRGA